jgi:chromosomal replication initiation ATPase DnaA
VIHACKRINELCASDEDLKHSYSNLIQSLAA